MLPYECRRGVTRASITAPGFASQVAQGVVVPANAVGTLNLSLVYITPASKLSGLKSMSAGTTFSLAGPEIVTASSTTFADGSDYIEDPDRSSGIKVIPSSGTPAVALGDNIGLVGTVQCSTPTASP